MINFLIITVLVFVFSSKSNRKNINNNIRYKKRKIDDVTEPQFEDLKIYYDLANYNHEIGSLVTYNESFILAMNKSKSALAKIVEIEILNDKPLVTDEELELWGIDKYNTTMFGDPNTDSNRTFPTETNLNYVIFFKFANLGTNAHALPEILTYSGTNVPAVGLITFNNNTNIVSRYSNQTYLNNIMLHQITHLLGFYYDAPTIFETGIINQLGDEYILETPNVIAYAKEYFNCYPEDGYDITKIVLDITTIELFDSDGNVDLTFDIPHWPAKLLLGEYMTDFFYTEEQVISGFTLAFFKDLGYLRVKKDLTGGLMRFGKHKGCNFYNGGYVYTTKEFKNEFYYPQTLSVANSEQSCSSGRTSKTVYKIKQYDSTLDNPYFTDNDMLGGYYEQAGYLPVAVHEDLSYLDEDSCLNIVEDADYGEYKSNTSFCVLSSLVKNTVSPQVKAVCLNMTCSSKSLTIKVKDNYIVCPREGGKIKAKSYNGFLLCPDYNLICTSTEMCNNIYDCINKGSEEKVPDYSDYENNQIKTTQIKSEYIEAEFSTGFEKATDGFCPQYCSQCDASQNCIECAPHYKPSDNKKQCIFNDKEYYLDNSGVYRLCLDNSSLGRCKECELQNGELTCLLCENSDYSLVHGETNVCKPKSDFISGNTARSYFTMDDGINFYLCSDNNHHSVNKCQACQNNSTCETCQAGYSLYNVNKLCLNEDDLKSYFLDDNGNYQLCNESMPNCENCKNEKICTKCENDYSLTDEDQCLPSGKKIENYYFNEGVGKYMKCKVDYCEECSPEDKCSKCRIGYELNDNKCIDGSNFLDGLSISSITFSTVGVAACIAVVVLYLVKKRLFVKG